MTGNLMRAICGTCLLGRGKVYWAGGGWSTDPAKATINNEATEGGAGRTERNLRIAQRHGANNHVGDVRVTFAPKCDAQDREGKETCSNEKDHDGPCYSV